MTKHETEPFDPRAFAATVVPPKDPYKGYDARQAELSQKDHPWAQPVEIEDTPTDTMPASQGPYDKYPPVVKRTPAEQQRQDEINARGKALGEAVLRKDQAVIQQLQERFEQQ